jgi:hypothetical protein
MRRDAALQGNAARIPLRLEATMLLKAMRLAPVFVLLVCRNAPAAVTLQDAFPNLSFVNPVDFQHPGDGTDRLFVVEQSGIIDVFANDPEVLEKNVFLDIQDRVDHFEGPTSYGQAQAVTPDGRIAVGASQNPTGDIDAVLWERGNARAIRSMKSCESLLLKRWVEIHKQSIDG